LYVNILNSHLASGIFARPDPGAVVERLEGNSTTDFGAPGRTRAARTIGAAEGGVTAMSVLYYWRPDNYRRDAVFGFGYHLNQDSPALAQVAPGESVWAFTRSRDGRYVLAAELVVRR